LCLRATHPEPASVTLAMKLKVAAAQFGIAADERPFTPHITLIRKARQPVQVDFKPIIWTTDSFCLAESRSSPEGVEYRVLRRW
jgi:2'-5' RNA ligase